MSSPAEQPTTPSGPSNPDVDEQLHGIWTKYGQAILLACGLVVVFYLGKVGWDAWQEHNLASVQQEYASAHTPEQWRAFAAAHPNDKLAGIADLQVADDAYAAGRFADAQSAYEHAQNTLKGGVLEVRAKLGAAMAQIQLGQVAQGKTALQAIMNDAKQPGALRTEAGYQLASLAAAAGDRAEVQRIGTELFRIDPSSPWSRKALVLRP